jgi:hypothetical protein
VRLAAATVPDTVIETVQPPVHVPTVVEAEPRLACVLFSSVTASVSPAHACGTLRTLTWVTLLLLSTLRVAVRADVVQRPTVACPAESFAETSPRVAAAATPTVSRVIAIAMPRMRVSLFTYYLPGIGGGGAP